MNEIIETLERLLERGVVVEPTTATPFGPLGYRVRLATDDDQSAEEQIAGESTDTESGLTW